MCGQERGGDGVGVDFGDGGEGLGLGSPGERGARDKGRLFEEASAMQSGIYEARTMMGQGCESMIGRVKLLHIYAGKHLW